MHFSEIIKLQFGKERHTLLCISKLLQILLINYLRQMRGYSQFSFRISITLVKICFSRIFSKPRKNTFQLVGTVLKSAQELVQHVSVHSGWNWNLAALAFEVREKPEYPEKNLSEEEENQQQTHPTCDAGTGNQTRATLVGGECSHHCATPAPQIRERPFYSDVSHFPKEFCPRL